MTGSPEASQLLSVDVIVTIELPADQPIEVDTDRLVALVHFVLAAENQTGPWEIAVALVSDEHLQRLHAEFIGIDEPTDVMTFPTTADTGLPQERLARGGDIVVSVDRAGEQGPEHGLTLEVEVAFLSVHGALHLCGWDDDDSERRTAMLQRGTELLTTFDAQLISG